MKTFLLSLFGLILLSGCVNYRKNFISRPVADIGFFADSTITMLGDLDMTLAREDTLLVRRFFMSDEAEEQTVMEMDAGLKKALANVVRYSVTIVNIAESDGTETNKVEAYANYLLTFRDSLVQVEEIDFEVFDNTIEEVMQQQEFREALRKAQPLLNAAVMQIALQIEDLITALDVLAEKIDGRIDQEYADIIRFRTKLEREKSDIMTAFELIYDAYRMDEPNLDELRKSGVIWMPELIPEGRPVTEDLDRIGQHLQTRMQALQAAQTAIQPNWEDYLATHKELDMVIDTTVKSALHSRILLLTWVRAHQKMASGTTDPAKWFDVGEMTKQLIKTAPGSLL